jgi:hypothetical protein
MFGYQNETNNYEFIPFNGDAFPIRESFGTVNPKAFSNGNLQLNTIQTPNRVGEYLIQGRFESKEESFPFSLIINVVAKINSYIKPLT